MLSVYIYIYTLIYICTYIYIYVCAYVCICKYVQIWVLSIIWNSEQEGTRSTDDATYGARWMKSKRICIEKAVDFSINIKSTFFF